MTTRLGSRRADGLAGGANQTPLQRRSLCLARGPLLCLALAGPGCCLPACLCCLAWPRSAVFCSEPDFFSTRLYPLASPSPLAASIPHSHSHIFTMAAAAPTLHSQDLQWLLVRKSNSYIVKQKGLGKVFSREPSNLAQIHSYTVSCQLNG